MNDKSSSKNDNNSPPKMAAWNLGLRFVLEVVAFVGLAVAFWSLTSGSVRWIAVIIIPIAAATAWGTLNVIDDPSRSGKAPIVVPGWVRLVVELVVLFGAAIALAYADKLGFALVYTLLIVFHYATSWSRVTWLIKQ